MLPPMQTHVWSSPNAIVYVCHWLRCNLPWNGNAPQKLGPIWHHFGTKETKSFLLIANVKCGDVTQASACLRSFTFLCTKVKSVFRTFDAWMTSKYKIQNLLRRWRWWWLRRVSELPSKTLLIWWLRQMLQLKSGQSNQCKSTTTNIKLNSFGPKVSSVGERLFANSHRRQSWQSLRGIGHNIKYNQLNGYRFSFVSWIEKGISVSSAVCCRIIEEWSAER